MQLRLMEIELHTDAAGASKRFYEEQLGLETHVDEAWLKVFGTEGPGP